MASEAGDRTNEELGWLAARGSSDAVRRRSFEELFRRLWRATVEWSLAAGAPDRCQAEDAATQAWLRAWRYRHRYDQRIARYGAWISTIVRNETLTLLRAESRLPMCESVEIEQLELLDDSPEGGPDAGLTFVVEALDALRKAKPDFAAAVRLKAEGYPDREIGALLGLAKEGTVASRLFRARRYVAGWLAEQGLFLMTGAEFPGTYSSSLMRECRTSVGVLYSCSPEDGLFVLPVHLPGPSGARLVCEGFMVRVWAYDLTEFRIAASEDEAVPGFSVVFRWRQYVVLAARGSAESATPA
jgi:DNA-directed RNA polymerase specialized sigma24 family protein